MIIYIDYLFIFLSITLINALNIDLKTCKITHAGTEYIGFQSKTDTNFTCQYWNSATQKGSEKITDEFFPEGSKVLAKNYCRNPTNDPIGPWCYTGQQKLIYDSCGIPLCKSAECRVSGIGVEYSGSIQKSSSGRKCTKWKDTHVLKKRKKEKTFKNKFFPDGSINLAGRKCRNPSGNMSGPWCYVEDDDSDFQERELCDIPFCDDLEAVMYSKGSISGEHFFFSSFNRTQSLIISFRLWNPADWLKGQVYLFLSSFDTPLNRTDLERWNSGAEIMLAHSGSTVLTKDEHIITKTPLILSGAQWTNLEITWINSDNSSLLIQVFNPPNPKPIAINEILIQGTIFEIESFRYFSLAGSAALWAVSSEKEECFVHSVPQMNFTRFWLIKKTTLGKDIEIFVRARQNAIILLRTAPMIETNQIQITLGEKDRIRIVVNIDKKQLLLLKETKWPNMLNFWEWKYFKISMLKDKLQIFLIHGDITELVIETIHRKIENVMWVSFASETISYWTIYCDPRGISDPPAASPPECVVTDADPFSGTLSVTQAGKQCIPWTDTASVPKKYRSEELFKPYGGKIASQNFCRNLDHDPKGAYCIVKDNSTFVQEYCHPRSCSLGDCKLAGTGNDYTGRLNITRSKRECRVWAEVKDEKLNVTNFPDPSITDAGNFCRNPTKYVAGNWCYTTDSTVPIDMCFIRDCNKPLECTILTSGRTRDIYMYILPAWRKYGVKFSVKAWNPDIYEGLVITMWSMNKTKKYILFMGDEENEKLKFSYGTDKEETLQVQKTLPHLIPSGKWGSYWLRPGHGKIELGYQGVPISFFDWVSQSDEMAFDPVFINFGTIHDHWIGINFPCTECLIEQISVNKGNKMYPINLWKSEISPSKLVLNLRGTGAAIIMLMLEPDFTKFLGLQIFGNEPNIYIMQYKKGDNYRLMSNFRATESLLEKEWSEYTLSFTENSLTLLRNDVQQFTWRSQFPLLFYWFSVVAEGGTITWSANCPPADIDGEPRDGSWGRWSPWSCSVSCGKGEGRIDRKCDSPPPNILGKECNGSPTYEGPCNDFPCGEISPTTNDKIRLYLSSQFKSLKANLKDRVVLTCNPEAISLITSEVSEMNITWTHNGFPYSKIKFHMNENYSLVIPQAHEKYNGVYLCMAYQDPERIPSKVILEVISLIVVRSRPDQNVRKGGKINLKCYGLALSYVYADLAQRWELNGTTWKDYGLGSIQTFTVEKLDNVSESHEGVWTCVVEQKDLGFNWTTNWIYLKVISAPNFWSYLMEDVATAPIFGKLGNEKNVMIVFFTLISSSLATIFTVAVFLVRLLKNKNYDNQSAALKNK